MCFAKKSTSFDFVAYHFAFLYHFAFAYNGEGASLGANRCRSKEIKPQHSQLIITSLSNQDLLWFRTALFYPRFLSRIGIDAVETIKCLKSWLRKNKVAWVDEEWIDGWVAQVVAETETGKERVR